MQRTLKIAIMMILVTQKTYAEVHEQTTMNTNERILFIRSLPGYPGSRSNLYEVYMEPYFFVIGMKAVVEMKALGKDGSPIEGPRGSLTLEQQVDGVKINGTITGLSPGIHGFHVHEKGDLREGCDSAGPHFNPYMVNHGAPNDPLRHVGDLGNIEVGPDGVAQINGMDHYLSLVGVRGAIGRALVIHAKPDDFGRGGTEESIKTGSAGARLACGIIGFS
ncbi:superoxide dismutase [Cu-Zn]-like [Vespula pensylvanica]|uniref:superoxide dismutase [Cu-Zn]-like n=1 Tax=Vespula pensylvanica TaxID=30213 RepID=UPI001CBA1E5D|nr:superoxide dismutase [Cu-Zn]-like [Vespula pensylvanica]XP_043673370.1 superoxide dismutase [Cu-Zn]-like [Vespula pensylvanica]